jgi:2-oxoglutarate dehydrogenase complex dehydrogenase (E1) component-like enzyme
MADRTVMALERPAKAAKGNKKNSASSEQRERVFDAFRRWGYYEATLDPLGVFQPQKLADLELTGEAAEEARRIYCRNIGVEFMLIFLSRCCKLATLARSVFRLRA